MAASSHWPLSGTFPTDKHQQYGDSFAASLAAVRASIGVGGTGMPTAPNMGLLHHHNHHPSSAMGSMSGAHHQHLHHPASYKPPSLYSLGDRHLSSATTLNPQHARMESLLDIAAASSPTPRNPSSNDVAAASYFTSHQYNASHAATVGGNLPPLSTAIPAYCHHSAHHHPHAPPSQPANLDAETMKYLAQSAASNAAKEMARAESWARASMLAVARTENPFLLPPSPLPYLSVGRLNDGMSTNPYSSLQGPTATVMNSSVDPRLAGAPQYGRSTTLSLPTDKSFLNEAQCLIRTSCLELFVSTEAQVVAPGKGARPCMEGQVGLRCMHCRHIPRKEQAKQAVCYPSKLENIFEGVRNFQRVHMEACPYIPVQIKLAFKDKITRANAQKKAQKLIKAYYAQAASEVGLMSTLNGLAFEDRPYNPYAAPSEKLLRIMHAANSYTSTIALLEENSNCKKKDKYIESGKFEHVATESTRCVLINSRREPATFLLTNDYPGVSDFIWLLFHQIGPCVPTAAAFKRRGLKFDPSHNIPGLCCKHCSHASKKENKPQTKGMYFPLNVESLGDSSFSQTLLMHLMSCPNVPEDVKEAFSEVKMLSDEHRVSTKRGSKRKFIEKVWGRMESYHSRMKQKEQQQLC